MHRVVDILNNMHICIDKIEENPKYRDFLL